MGAALMLAVGLGVAVAVQVFVLGRSNDVGGPLAVSLALQAAGLLVGAVWVVLRGELPEVLAAAGRWWWLPLGALGWGLVAGLAAVGRRLGVAPALAIVVGAQLTAGLLLDVLGSRGEVTPRHILGLVLMLAGVALVATPVRG